MNRRNVVWWITAILLVLLCVQPALGESKSYEQYVTLMQDQNGHGGCFGYSATQVLQILEERELPYSPDLSYGFHYYVFYSAMEGKKLGITDPRVDDNPWIDWWTHENTTHILEKYGAAPETSYPTNFDAINGSWLNKSLLHLPSNDAFSLAQNHRIQLNSIEWKDPSVATVEDLLDETPLVMGGLPLGHAVALIGYDSVKKEFTVVDADRAFSSGPGIKKVPYATYNNEIKNVSQNNVTITRIEIVPRSFFVPEEIYTARIKINHDFRRAMLTVKIGAVGHEPVTVWEQNNKIEYYDSLKNLTIDVPLPDYAAEHWPPSETNSWYVQVINHDPDVNHKATIEEITLVKREAGYSFPSFYWDIDTYSKEGLPISLSPGEYRLLIPTGNDLEVKMPNGGERWTPGTTQYITWDHGRLNPPWLADYVKIQLVGPSEWTNPLTIATGIPANTGMYEWPVPADLEPDIHYWVKISSIYDPTIWDETDGYLEITPRPTIKMTSPNGGEKWGIGTTHDFSWNQTRLEATDVKIMLFDGDHPSKTYTIADSSPAHTGVYSWKIPTNITPGSEFFVGIWSLSNSSIYDINHHRFEITPPPTLKVTSPNSGEKWGLGTTHAFTWNQTGLEDTDVKIELMQVNGMFTVVRRTIAASTPAGTGTFSWPIPTDLTPGTDYTVRVTSLNVPSVKDSSDGYFEITPTPTVTVTSPNGGESWGAGTIHTITWDQTGLADTNAKLELWKGEFAVNPKRIINSSVPAGTGTYSWTIPPDLVPATDYWVRITSLNVPTVKDSSDGFLRSTPLPTLHVTSPNGGEKWVNSTKHAINWTQTGLTGTNVKIDLYHGGEFLIFRRTIAASVPAQNNTYPWTIPADLAPDTDYWIKITSLNAPSVNDFSDAGFKITILPSLHITALSFTKSISVDNATWVDTSVNVTAGSTVYYNLTVKNTGDCTLISVHVNDDGSITNAQFVDPGATWKQYFRKTAGPVNHTNTATASGTSAYGSTSIITDNASYRIIKPKVMIQPVLTEMNLSSTKTVTLVLDEAPSGVSGYNLTITPTNPQVTQVLSVTYPAWAASQHANSTLPGDTFWMKATDGGNLVKPGAKNVLLATLTVRGDVSGTTVFNIQADLVDDDFGNPLSPTTVPGTIRVVPGVATLPGYTNPPMDPDGDGIYEDLNGNARLDFADVVLYFNQMEWIAANEPVSAFDLNGNGRIDFADIVKLFGEI